MPAATIGDVMNAVAGQVSTIVHVKRRTAETEASTSEVLVLLRVLLARLNVAFPTATFDVMLAFQEPELTLWLNGLALTVASIVRRDSGSTRPDGPMTRIKLGTDEWEFARPALGEIRSQSESWMDEAWADLRLIAVFAAEWAEVSEQPIFLGSSKRKLSRSALGVPATNPLYSLFADDLSTFNWTRTQAVGQ